MNITRNILLDGVDIKAKRAEIREYFINTFELFEKVFEIFTDDSVFYERPEKRRHQLIFYFGHTAAFYINKLVFGGFIKQRLNERFESIFAIGVDEMSWDDLNTNSYQWPSVDEVRAYRRSVKEVVLDFINDVDFVLPIDWNSQMWVIMMGCEHERIHIETSSVLHRQLDISKIKANSFCIKECTKFGDAPKNELLFVNGANVKLGKSFDDKYYGWDNEYGIYNTTVSDFKASKYLVSNGEFLEFVQDDGYQKDELWSDEGKHWKNYEKITHPIFWVKKDSGYLYRTLTKKIQMPLDWPVDVNFLEAEAFCNWKSKNTNKIITLPSEAMWNRLFEVCAIANESNWKDEAPANINLEYYSSSSPVNVFKHGDFYDVIGNVWQWTTTAIDGFEGFAVHPLYDDFSTPTFDGKHAIIKGGSWISTGNEVLKESRYAFRKHFYQHAGFRYVEVDDTYTTKHDYIEKDKEVIEAICEQFENKNDFYKSLMASVSTYTNSQKISKALVIECGVGRMGFELTKLVNRVFAIDFSARFIRAGDYLKKEGYLKYSDKVITIKDFDCANIDTTRLEFWQGDVCNLKPVFNGFDFLFAHNFSHKLYDLDKFNKTIAQRLLENSIAIFSFESKLSFELPFNFYEIDRFGLDNFIFIVSRKL